MGYVAIFAQKLEGRRRRQNGFWPFFRDCCGQRAVGGMVENILADVTAVKREEWYCRAIAFGPKGARHSRKRGNPEVKLGVSFRM